MEACFTSRFSVDILVHFSSFFAMFTLLACDDEDYCVHGFACLTFDLIHPVYLLICSLPVSFSFFLFFV